jgi:hypothetical protein
MIELLWIRVGDAGEYEGFDGLEEALDYLNELSVGEVTGWVDGPCAIGFETPNFWGCDCISCFWGDADAQLTRRLTGEERTLMEANLMEAFI